MKIGIVIWRMAYSGAENVANALIQQFRKDGHEVHVILTANNTKLDKSKYVHDASFEGNKIIRIIKRSIYIRNLANKEKFDVIIGFGHIDSIHILRALLFCNVTKVACERMDPATYPFKKSQRIERDFMYKYLDGIILQTNEQKAYYEKLLKVKTAVIPNPVRNTLCPALPVNERDKVFVTVARLDNAQKNHFFMFRCFELFLDVHPGYILKLYGDGPDRKMYEEYIEEHNLKGKIELCGKVDNPQEYIKKATAFLLTSNHEGMPNSLIEAMSMGLPCISTECGGGGANDLIQNGVNGFLIPKGDEKEFVAAMCKLADSEILQEELGGKAMDINSFLNIQSISKKWIDALLLFKKESGQR